MLTLYRTRDGHVVDTEAFVDAEGFNARRRELWRRGELGIPSVSATLADIDEDFVWTVRPNGVWSLPEGQEHVRMAVQPLQGWLRASAVAVDASGVVYGRRELQNAAPRPTMPQDPAVVLAGWVQLAELQVAAMTADLLFRDSAGRIVLVDVLRLVPWREGENTWLATTSW